MASMLKNSKIELLTDIDMLLMEEKGVREGICNAIHRYETANHKYTKNYDKDNESWYIMYLDVNNLYGWAISQELPVDGFEWKKNKICQNLMKSLLKTMVKIVM